MLTRQELYQLSYNSSSQLNFASLFTQVLFVIQFINLFCVKGVLLTSADEYPDWNPGPASLAEGLRERDTVRASPGLTAHLSLTERRAQPQSLGGGNQVGAEGLTETHGDTVEDTGPLHRSAHSVATASSFYCFFFKFHLFCSGG